MQFPALSNAQRLALLEPPPAGKINIVLDTDTYNEIDDQFALAYTLLSPERITVEAVYAAPFHNERSTGPEDGMLKSYDEIYRVLDRLEYNQKDFVFHGSRSWLSSSGNPVPSPAANDLIARAKHNRNSPLYVVAIGAITNIASAILAAPEIIDNIVIVWLGGNPHYWHKATEFNVYQDMAASRLIFNCGVSFVHIPCINVTEHLRTTQAELERFVKGRSAIGDYLFEIYSAYFDNHFARSKIIWDIGPIAWLQNPSWVETVLIHSPKLSTDNTWSYDNSRHFIREARSLNRDDIFRDLFKKLDKHGKKI